MLKRKRLLWALAIPSVVVAVLWGGHRSLQAAPVPCSGTATEVRVVSKEHTMVLCEAGRLIARYRVRLGKHGVGKMREGDGKTPQGHYQLGPPRASTLFGTFIPIGYPNETERTRGYTGTAVGIHGPHRFVRWAGALTNVVDSTDGCIGLSSLEQTNEVASWVRRLPEAKLVIE
jgi:L,D-transpeptidase catalytic domain